MHRRLALALILASGVVAAEPGTALHGITSLPRDRDGFGGLSAIEVLPGGASAYVASDRGGVFRLTLDRARAMSLSAITSLHHHDRDTEGLALSASGRLFLSYEGPAAVDLIAAALPRHPDFARMQPNAALEALAIDAEGALYTLPERSGQEDAPFPLYVYRSDAWSRGPDIPRSGGYLMVGADFGPDGLLYLLERGVTLRGFRSRIRRFDLAVPDLAEQTILETAPGTHGNLEGLSLWQDAAGRTILTMISDDNFLALQRSEIVEYVLTE